MSTETQIFLTCLAVFLLMACSEPKAPEVIINEAAEPKPCKYLRTEPAHIFPDAGSKDADVWECYFGDQTCEVYVAISDNTISEIKECK